MAVVAVPVYFNTGDVRAFEPDKAILLRDLAALLAMLCALRLTLWLGLAGNRAAPWHHSPAQVSGGSPARVPIWRAIWRLLRGRPTLLPMLLLAGVTLLACATSLLPAASWHGSYARALCNVRNLEGSFRVRIEYNLRIP